MQEQIIVIFLSFLLDYLSGIQKARKTGTYKSALARSGLKDHSTNFLIACIMVVGAHYLHIGSVGWVLVSMFAYPNATSFGANMKLSGYPIPKKLEQFLEAEIKEKTERHTK